MILKAGVNCGMHMSMPKVEVVRNGGKDFTLVFLPTNAKSDTIFIDHINSTGMDSHDSIACSKG